LSLLAKASSKKTSSVLQGLSLSDLFFAWAIPLAFLRLLPLLAATAMVGALDVSPFPVADHLWEAVCPRVLPRRFAAARPRSPRFVLLTQYGIPSATESGGTVVGAMFKPALFPDAPLLLSSFFYRALMPRERCWQPLPMLIAHLVRRPGHEVFSRGADPFFLFFCGGVGSPAYSLSDNSTESSLSRRPTFF